MLSRNASAVSQVDELQQRQIPAKNRNLGLQQALDQPGRDWKSRHEKACDDGKRKKTTRRGGGRRGGDARKSTFHRSSTPRGKRNKTSETITDSSSFLVVL
ncbi:hypothetical protein KOW79_021163 [Hemibagrus wyckioides]|uniref:Uncharacterized protein n=1 Tax=Hemibagrus wyckioides TaxID=337641 RepID=A0A9D3N5W0_9TELE|nr:hypothetical protein KOW79_021163 [Hemibagrus wyckioides]